MFCNIIPKFRGADRKLKQDHHKILTSITNKFMVDDHNMIARNDCHVYAQDMRALVSTPLVQKGHFKVCKLIDISYLRNTNSICYDSPISS